MAVLSGCADNGYALDRTADGTADRRIAPLPIATRLEPGRVLRPARSQVPLLQHLERGFAALPPSAGDRQKPISFYRRVVG